MAGEWIAYDLGLPDKPEVQELIDETGQPVEVIVFRLLRLWGWAAMNTTDGRARMTVARLVRTCGADDAFWRAVAAVGWLEIDETDATVAIPGWDRRFSQAAKSRLQNADRATAYEDRRRRAGDSRAQARDAPAPTRGRGEEKRGEDPPPPREGSTEWPAFRDRWNAGAGKPWKPSTPPDGWEEAAARPGWLSDALEALERLPRCRYFRTPVPLTQFLAPKFVPKCLGGGYDDIPGPKVSADPQGGRESAEDAAARWRAGLEQSKARNAEYLALKGRRAPT